MSIVAAAITYRFIENPIRQSKVLAKSALLSIALGLLIVIGVLVVTTYEIHSHS